MLKKLKWLLFIFKQRIKRLRIQLSFLKRRIIPPNLAVNSSGDILIHIGCGELNSPEFINVDAKPFPHVHVVTENIVDLPMLGSGTADLIYMCHILEHIKRREVLEVLWEMKRILKKGGILRLSVPDFDQLIEIYTASGNNIDAIFTLLMGGQNERYDIHYSIFNFRYLSGLFNKAGFNEVREWDPYNCDYHNFDDTASLKLFINGREYCISLNIEAVK